MATAPLLTPLQDSVRTELFALGQPRPTFDIGLRRRLHHALTDRLADAAERLELVDAVVAVDKRALARVMRCERNSVADRFPGWSPATARGTVAHKAIELGVFVVRDAPPLELVDMAVDRIVEDGDDWTPRSWLIEAGAAEVAELRSAANDVVSKFFECFPPLSREWRPRFESSRWHELHAGRIRLGAKVDLALGMPRGNEARVLIVDFKTGHRYPDHLLDLRHYALIEALRSGVPPFRVASYYLDSGTWDAEDVDDDLLERAVARAVDGTIRMVELHLGEREPTVTPGPQCSYCSERPTCDAASAPSGD